MSDADSRTVKASAVANGEVRASAYLPPLALGLDLIHK
jgi:hypothetical protein